MTQPMPGREPPFTKAIPSNGSQSPANTSGARPA
jgi:hypothetical protein